MTRLSATQAKDEFTEMLERVIASGDPVVVQRDGEDVAALIPIEDLRLFARLFEEEEDRIDIARAQEALKEPGAIPWEQVKAELGLEDGASDDVRDPEASRR